MSNRDDKELFLSTVAYMHYIDGLSQKEISEILKISRPTVNRIIQKARDKGIVKIEVTLPVLKNISLENALSDKYKLEKSIIVSNISKNKDNLLDFLGRAGADYILESVKDGMTIGFSMGETLKKIADYIGTDKKYNCTIVPILGGMGHNRPEIHPNEICRVVAEKLGGAFYPLYVPAIAGSSFERDILMSDQAVKKIFDVVMHADMIVVGVGSINSATLRVIGSLSVGDVQAIEENGGIGDIGNWYIDANGKAIDASINNRLVGPGFDKLRENTKVVIISGGKEKHEILKAALKGGWADVVITDEESAKFLLA